MCDQRAADVRLFVFYLSHGLVTVCEIIRIHHECEGGKENPSRGSPFGITRLAEWWQTVIPRDGLFYPILPWIMDYFSSSPLNTSFYIGKTCKGLPENPEYTEMQYGDVISTLQWRHGSTCGQHAADVQLFTFYLSHGLVQVFRDGIKGNLLCFLTCIFNFSFQC